MNLVVFDEIVKASGLSEAELLLELVVLLFNQDKISLGKAAELLKMPQIRFQRLIAERGICIHYGVAEFQEDIQQLTTKGWLQLSATSNSTNSVVTNLALWVSRSFIILSARGCSSSSALARAIHAAVSTKIFTRLNLPALVCHGDDDHVGELNHEFCIDLRFLE